jgi:hypothetical protein
MRCGFLSMVSLASPVRGEVRHSKDLPPPKSADAVRPAVGISRRNYRGHPVASLAGALDLSNQLRRWSPRADCLTQSCFKPELTLAAAVC